MSGKIFVSRLTNVFQNLAFEDYLFTSGLPPILFLYRNDKTIVIGRNQNPWKECHVDRMHQDQVQLCRRKSGGGAVYQDLGNSCFSFISAGPAKVDFKEVNNQFLLKALRTLGVQAEVKGRNDLTLGDRKISGSAYKLIMKQDTILSLHHGTMLLSVDKEGLMKYLNPNKAKLLSKGVASAAARVVNISEMYQNITHQTWCEAMIRTFRETHPGSEATDVKDLSADVRRVAESFLDWDWRYGSSPAFSHHLETRFPWGTLDINLQVESGLISQAKVFSDSLTPDFIDKLNEEWPGVKYGLEGLEELRKRMGGMEPRCMEDVITWLGKTM